uniref:Uncharacterized protein n=1 Tax=Globodera pallida TaxID=36090 RepID=A0A183BV75_GLOPA
MLKFNLNFYAKVCQTHIYHLQIMKIFYPLVFSKCMNSTGGSRTAPQWWKTPIYHNPVVSPLERETYPLCALAVSEQVVGRDGGRRKKSDERHWGASARGPAKRARARPPAGSRADFFRSPESRPTYWPP